ncbi:unnamed protein product [Phytophthora lilii]|uniref:Unnamed protein product n=1 Tax=Phytophthora lilii TaxID=2077276 RepID=A0A9W6TKC1_9STRA|nr:unnamed protein product [Phytophthora lilii]
MGVIPVQGDADWNAQMQRAGGKLVVVDFSAVWCGPCQHIKPVYHQLSGQYSDVVFLEVDEAQNRSLISALGVRGFPTFHFYVNQSKVDELVGADPNQLRAKIEQWRQSAFNPFASPGMTLGASAGGDAKPLSAAEAREARLKRFNNVSLVPNVPAPAPAAPKPAAKPAVPDSSLVCDPATGVCRPKDDDEEMKEEGCEMGPPPVNEDLLTQLTEMGFDDLRSRKALLATDNQGLEVAINWLGDHQDDADIDEPIKFVDLSKAKPKRQLTPEEKAAKVEELKARIAKKRAEREEQEKLDQRTNELKRRTEGQGMLEARDEIEAIQRKIAAEKMKKDKEDAKRERERLRKQLEMDKRERHARGGRLGGPPIDLALADVSTKQEEEKKKSPVLSPKQQIVKNVGILKQYRVGNDGLTAIKTLNVYVKNLIEKPDEEKFRTINLENPAFRKRVASLVGGVAFLKSLGYEKDEADGNLKLSVEKRDVELLHYARTQLQGAIAELTN